MAHKRLLPVELRPDYYPRIAMKYREMELEDPEVLKRAVDMAHDEFSRVSAKDPVYSFYQNQHLMLKNYLALVDARARYVSDEIPDTDEVSRGFWSTVFLVTAIIVGSALVFKSLLG